MPIRQFSEARVARRSGGAFQSQRSRGMSGRHIRVFKSDDGSKEATVWYKPGEYSVEKEGGFRSYRYPTGDRKAKGMAKEKAYTCARGVCGLEKDYDESKHPRDEKGKFSEGGGGSGGGTGGRKERAAARAKAEGHMGISAGGDALTEGQDVKVVAHKKADTGKVGRIEGFNSDGAFVIVKFGDDRRVYPASDLATEDDDEWGDDEEMGDEDLSKDKDEHGYGSYPKGEGPSGGGSSKKDPDGRGRTVHDRYVRDAEKHDDRYDKLSSKLTGDEPQHILKLRGKAASAKFKYRMAARSSKTSPEKLSELQDISINALDELENSMKKSSSDLLSKASADLGMTDNELRDKLHNAVFLKYGQRAYIERLYPNSNTMIVCVYPAMNYPAYDLVPYAVEQRAAASTEKQLVKIEYEVEEDDAVYLGDAKIVRQTYVEMKKAMEDLKKAYRDMTTNVKERNLKPRGKNAEGEYAASDESFIKNVKAAMKENEITFVELAQMVGRDKDELDREFSGDEPFSRFDKVRIADALEMPLDEYLINAKDLMKGEDEICDECEEAVDECSCEKAMPDFIREKIKAKQGEEDEDEDDEDDEEEEDEPKQKRFTGKLQKNGKYLFEMNGEREEFAKKLSRQKSVRNVGISEDGVIVQFTKNHLPDAEVVLGKDKDEHGYGSYPKGEGPSGGGKDKGKGGGKPTKAQYVKAEKTREKLYDKAFEKYVKKNYSEAAADIAAESSMSVREANREIDDFQGEVEDVMSDAFSENENPENWLKGNDKTNYVEADRVITAYEEDEEEAEETQIKESIGKLSSKDQARYKKLNEHFRASGFQRGGTWGKELNQLEAKAKSLTSKSFTKLSKSVDFIDLSKVDAERGVVYGIAYSPDEVDLQKEWATGTTIRDAAENFMQKYNSVKVQHRDPSASKIVYNVVTEDGDRLFGKEWKKDTWIVGVKLSPSDLKKYKSGELTGLSIGGSKRIRKGTKPNLTKQEN